MNTEHRDWWIINYVHLIGTTVCSCLVVCMPTPLSLNSVAVKCLCLCACMHVCVFTSARTTVLPPAHSINAQPCPRLICHSCCIFAFILICTSPLNWLSICPSRCSNLIVFVHYRWASNKVDTHTQISLHITEASSLLYTPPPTHTYNTYSLTVNICFIFNVLASH